MSNILVISGHPDLSQSYTNNVILDQLKQARGDIRVHDLASLYPDSKVDVAAEQAALLEAEVIVLQFPFYWYSVPGIMKQWMDDVMTYGFAYGSTGDKLKGKKLIVSTTIGGPEASYQHDGFNEYTVDELLGNHHNMVRHPDMPKPAFADLWATIQNGKSWMGPVKNRCKNGDYYWVNAFVTPIKDDHGNVVEYQSVRTKLNQDVKERASQQYQQINSGKKAAHKEMDQLHQRNCFYPMAIADLTPDEHRKAVEALMFLTEKRDGTIKGRMVYNGKPTREWLSREDSASPTASLESILITAVIDAHENRDVMTADVPNAFIQTFMPDHISHHAAILKG